jgi:hypothetical protein
MSDPLLPNVNQLGDIFVLFAADAGDEFEFVDGVVSFEHAAGDAIDLAGNEVGISLVHTQFTQ